MKKFTVAGSLMMLAGGLVFAQTTPSANPPTSKKGSGPCAQIVEACKTAGFTRSKAAAKQGKGLFKDCVGPIVKGQTVQGVDVDPSVAQACQQARANRRQKRSEQQQQTPPAQNPQ